MAYAEQSPRLTSGINEHASALAHEWRRLTRAATAVALLTAPAFFLILFDSNHWSLAASIIVTALAVVIFRGMVEVIARKLIPWPSLYGAEESLKKDDLTARRRHWYWRTKFRRLPFLIAFIFALLGLCQLLFTFAGVSAGFFHPFAGLRQIFPPSTLPQLALIFVQLPLLLFITSSSCSARSCSWPSGVSAATSRGTRAGASRSTTSAARRRPKRRSRALSPSGSPGRSSRRPAASASAGCCSSAPREPARR